MTTADAQRLGRHARFEALLEQARATHLADNLDHLVHPAGHELPDPEGEAERIEAARTLLDRADVLWSRLGDESSRELLLRILAYRALGPAHVRLDLDPLTYRQTVVQMSASTLRATSAVKLPRGYPLEWQLHLFDMASYGLPIKVIGQQLPVAQTLVLSQYAYRDAGVRCGPWEGDVALDLGGCWGETALWLAHEVGEYGEVHTFEPSAFNLSILTRNLELNPDLRTRIRPWQLALSDTAGERIWISDGFGAGIRIEASQNQAGTLAEKQTQTVDAMVASGELSRVDFLKVDVEGAEPRVLQGAAETIRQFQPRLAIAAYHLPDHVVTLPEFVNSLGVEYRWYLQASTLTDVDFVAFGIPAGQA